MGGNYLSDLTSLRFISLKQFPERDTNPQTLQSLTLWNPNPWTADYTVTQMAKQIPLLRTEVRDIIPLIVIVIETDSSYLGTYPKWLRSPIMWHRTSPPHPPKKTGISHTLHIDPQIWKCSHQGPRSQRAQNSHPWTETSEKIWRPPAMNTNTHEFTDLLCWDQDPKWPERSYYGYMSPESPCSLDIVTRDSEFIEISDISHLGHRTPKRADKPPKNW